MRFTVIFSFNMISEFIQNLFRGVSIIKRDSRFIVSSNIYDDRRSLLKYLIYEKYSQNNARVPGNI